MTKGPEVRVVGNASEEDKNREKDRFSDILFNHLESLTPEDKEWLKENEREKTVDELALIDFANKETSILLEEVGLEPYHIPAENYHILSSTAYDEAATGERSAGHVQIWKKGIFIDEAAREEGGLLHLGRIIIHETLHLKSHHSIQLNKTPDGEPVLNNYRIGVNTISTQEQVNEDKGHEHFKGLDEAIVSTLEKNLLGKLLDLPLFEKEKGWLLSDEATEIKKGLVQEHNLPEDSVVWVHQTTEDGPAINTLPYRRQREVLTYLCQEIQKQFPEKYSDTEAVFEEFVKAHFTGHLVTIGRLVEKTFGEGSFRLLGNMKTDQESGVLHLEALKKARMRQQRDSKKA